MPNVKISAAADAGTLLSSDMVPLARAGNTNAYHATMAEIATYTGASVASGAYGNVGRNLVHNSLFNVQQRGAGPWTTNVYTLDRWVITAFTDAWQFLPTALNDSARSQIGDESAISCLQNNFTGNAAAGAYNAVEQRIEGVRRLAGKTITVSFWAVSAPTGLKLGTNLYQIFGTGGSPSASVVVMSTGNAVTLSNSWARYSFTTTIPSAAGKTLGTNGDDATYLRFFYSSGASLAAQAGNIGVQSGTVQLWGLQLEIGSVATPLEKPDPQQDLAKCQRFFQVLPKSQLAMAAPVASATYTLPMVAFPTTMRATPTATTSNITYGNSSALTIFVQNNSVAQAFYTATGTGNTYATFDLALSADL